MKPEIPEKLTHRFIIQNADYSLESHSKNWRIWAWRQVVLLKVSGVWDPSQYPHHFSDFWDIFCARKRYWERVYFIVDANNMAIQSEAFRNYVKTNWLHWAERKDFYPCIVENKAMKRAIWTAIYKLLGIENKIRLFKNHDQALTWMRSVVLTEGLMNKKWDGD